jgi:excinuclease ABC subunit A
VAQARHLLASGGQLVAMGTPEQVAYVPASHTGKYLQEILSSGRLLQTVNR